MKKIQFILMASFVLGTCQLAVLSGAADELDVKESTIELSNNFVENSQVDNVQNSSETASEQVVEKLNLIVRQRKIIFFRHHRQEWLRQK
mgnify:FL=1